MYPKGCRSGSSSASIKVVKDGLTVTSANVGDSQNYGFVNQTWAAGTYTVYVTPSWTTNDVPDYTVRLYMPESVTITKAIVPPPAPGTVSPALLTDLASAKAVTTYTGASASYYAYKRGWFNSNLFFTISNPDPAYGYIYTVTITATATSSAIVSDGPTTCTPTTGTTYPAAGTSYGYGLGIGIAYM